MGNLLEHLTDMLVGRGSKVFDELGGGVRYTHRLISSKCTCAGISIGSQTLGSINVCS